MLYSVVTNGGEDGRWKDDRNTPERLPVKQHRLYNEPNSVEIKRSLSSFAVGSDGAISLSLSLSFSFYLYGRANSLMAPSSATRRKAT